MASEFEKNLIKDAINQIKRCAENHDMDSVTMMLRLCKYIAGDDFEVKLEKE